MQTSLANREVVLVPPAAPSSDDVVVLPLAIVVGIIVAVVIVGDVVAWARVHLHKGATSSWRQRLSDELPVE